MCKDYETGHSPLTVLDGLDLRLEAGDALAVTGPSGCGKSTLLHILGTLEPPTSGAVRIDGVDPFALPEAELASFRGREVGFVFQDHHLLPQFNVLQNVTLPTLAVGGNETDDRARELLAAVGLEERLTHRPAQLSGGERQRVAIARALINRPSLLLCDEPTGNLDPKTAEVVADLLFDLQARERRTMVVVTHSEELAERFENRLRLGVVAGVAS
ncbi:MAG: ABC transporter ATP-binding protein [Acidobacteriota bacterium]